MANAFNIQDTPAIISLATGVTGTLPIANGGTALTALPKFLATKGGVNQTIANTTMTIVTFGTEVYDINSNFASNTWTPTAGSFARVTVSLTLAGLTPGTTAQLFIFKNGSQYRQIGQFTDDGTINVNARFLGTCDVPINGTTDAIDLRIYQDTGVDETVDGTEIYTYFSGQVYP